jgi:outer membrane protein TolC
VGIGVPVMTFGRLHTAKRLAQGGVDAAKLRLSSLREDTIYQVKKIYYGIQLASETIRLLREAVNQLAKKIDDDADRELKQMDPYNTLKLKIFKSELENRIDEAQNNLELAYEGLRIQLDLEPEAEIKIDSLQLKPLLHEMEEERRFIETAMEHQPESKLLDIGVETRRRQYKLERLNLLPTAGLGFFADIGRAVGEIRGLVDTDDFNKAKAEYYKASYERLIARRGLSLEMKQAYLDTQRKRKEVSRAKKSESMAQQMVFLSKMNSDMGIGDDKDYAEAVKLLLVNRGQYFKTVFDFNMALANLEKKIGNSHFGKLTSVSDRPDYEVFGGDDDFDVHYKDTFFDEDHVDMEGRQNEDGI